MHNYKIYLFIIPILVLCVPLKRDLMLAKCVRVIDGDTIMVQRGTKKEKIRLAFIDAPEISQVSLFKKLAIGQRSKLYLEEKILNKNVKIKLYGRGKYKRWIGEVFLGEENINLDLILKGHAIIYKFEKYPSNFHRAHYHSSQFVSQNQRREIWATHGFENPSYYRKKGKKHVRK